MEGGEEEKKNARFSSRPPLSQGHRPLGRLRGLQRPRSLPRRCRDTRSSLLAGCAGAETRRKASKQKQERKRANHHRSPKQKNIFTLASCSASACLSRGAPSRSELQLTKGAVVADLAEAQRAMAARAAKASADGQRMNLFFFFFREREKKNEEHCTCFVRSPLAR